MAYTTAIFGPPGTGKTRTLMEHIASTKIEDMAVVSFSKAAARELSERASGLVTPKFIGTIHSFCFNQLQLSRGQVVSDIENHPDFMPGVDRTELIQALEIGRLARCKYHSLQDAYEHVSDLMVSIDMVQDTWDHYVVWKRHNGYIDFDDMLEQAVGKTQQFSLVVVDEGQDLSDLQWKVVMSMTKPSGEVLVAGDDDQSIFSWAGANPHGMASHMDSHSVLGQSHRVPARVHALATKTVNRINTRYHKLYSPASGQGYVATAGEYDPGHYPFPHTIMARDRYKLKDIEAEIILSGLPYLVEGTHGPGLFMSRRGRLVRAIRDKNIEEVAKFRAILDPRDRGLLDLGEIPNVHRVMRYWNEEEADYFYRVMDANPEDVRISLSTIHAQKGREFDHGVLVAHCSPRVESMQERSGDFDDEVRVWYTGLTRVKKGITIIGHNPYIPSF
jgi:superfamily I DNA/RNA helicase